MLPCLHTLTFQSCRVLRRLLLPASLVSLTIQHCYKLAFREEESLLDLRIWSCVQRISQHKDFEPAAN